MHAGKGRRRVAGSAAQAIEHLFPDGVAEMAPLLAYHFVRAEDSANAVKYLVLLADRSLHVYALKEADASLRQALALAARLAEPNARASVSVSPIACRRPCTSSATCRRT